MHSKYNIPVQFLCLNLYFRYKEEQRQQMKLKREIAIHQTLEHDNIIKFIQLDEGIRTKNRKV